MHIPEEKISEILHTSDIVDVISETVILKKSGRNHFGLCPFHSEKTPSFSVSSNKQIFHCFGCSAGGNVFSFLMKYHGVTFPEAVKMLAQRYNITVDTGTIDPRKKKEITLKENLLRLNKKVMDLYSHCLMEEKTLGQAKEYLKKRGTSDDIIEQFKLGFVPEKWDTVVQLLKKHKVSQETAIKSGLVLERKQQNGYYDRFRNRIMFPIFDINMQVAGFGGRVMDSSMPKYMNSPETPVYYKSRILYGLHEAKQYCRQEGFVYIVEGYFDFLTLFQHGIKNTVASLGTALTPDHVRILKGYAPKMILVFDSDQAGINAAKRSISVFMAEGVEIKVLVLPQGKDPDSFMVEYGSEAFRDETQKAKSVMQFLLQVAIEQHGLTVEGRVRILDEMKTHLRLIQDSALRSLYIKELAETLNIDEKAVLEKVREAVTAPNDGVSSLLHKQPVKEELVSNPREEQIISMMLQFPRLKKEVEKWKVLEYFYSPELKRIAQKIMSIDAKEDAFVTDVMAKVKNKEDQELIASFAMNDDFGERDIHEKAISLIQRIIKVKKKNDNVLTTKIISAEKGCDSDLFDLLKQKQQEIERLHDLKKL
ncbi:MAG: DNA primase [Desulfobacteraceae bacterium]|nr:DNA primase [Desulfobacteraceae bacterium]